MGITYVEAEVSNEAGTAQKVRFLVESGATYSVLPQEVWRALGQDERAPSPVVLGEANDAALLGTLTLEGLVRDPFQRTLRPARLSLAAVGPPAAAA
jgi:hypothetical protein